MSTGKCQTTLRGDKQINCVAFSPDGKILAVGDGELYESGNVLLYDPATGEVKSTLNGHSGPVLGVCFSPNGATIASCSTDTTVILWDVKRWAPTGGSPLSGHSDW